MRYARILWNVACFWILLGLCGWLHPNPAAAFSGMTIDPDRVEFIEMDADVMEVNVKKGYINVAETQFLITDFKIAGKLYRSSALDENGRAISFESLAEGQRVIVKAIKLSEATIAGIVQKVVAGTHAKMDSHAMERAASVRQGN